MELCCYPFSFLWPKALWREAATLPLKPTGMKNKARGKVQLIQKKHKPVLCSYRLNSSFTSYSSAYR